ncbi:hypothetical protein CAPTEDRAFT_166052 [Capitella teleta]|uniref:PID domain-containing protein n=1 Tax=Capitella teleta TaxID=283909 RepID=R7VME8_CAPTE|nr:hypothetical protein CAPTEDRAFT_166052 [Capitella teleta]|eukprot:ELU18715.1 hypothetical protein CAPTEDRAFT_166052 [Capitella teleta]
MDSILKGLKRVKAPRHKKLADTWNAEQSPVKDGVTFNAKYLGSTLVEELEDEAQSYGHSICSEAVKAIFTMSKASSKPFPGMNITVSYKGIKVTDTETNSIFTDLDIYRINFCSADKHHDRVFAYIARSTENETMECHAFLCAKRKVAHAIALTVAQAFHLAKEDCEEKEQKEIENRQQQVYELCSNDSAETASEGNQEPPCQEQRPNPLLCDISAGPLTAPELRIPAPVVPSHAAQSAPAAPNTMGFEDNFVPPPIPARPSQGFEDNFSDMILPASQSPPTKSVNEFSLLEPYVMQNSKSFTPSSYQTKDLNDAVFNLSQKSSTAACVDDLLCL